MSFKALDIPCPYLLAYRDNGDAAAHGANVAGAILGCVKKQLLSSMAACDVPEARTAPLLGRLLARMTTFATEAPKKYHTGGVVAFIHVAKSKSKEPGPPPPRLVSN